NAMELITGEPAEVIENTRHGGLSSGDIEQLREVVDDGGQVVLSSPRNGTREVTVTAPDGSTREVEIVSKHAYVVTRIEPDGSVWMRNPWGPDNGADGGGEFRVEADDVRRYFWRSSSTNITERTKPAGIGNRTLPSFAADHLLLHAIEELPEHPVRDPLDEPAAELRGFAGDVDGAVDVDRRAVAGFTHRGGHRDPGSAVPAAVHSLGFHDDPAGRLVAFDELARAFVGQGDRTEFEAHGSFEVVALYARQRPAGEARNDLFQVVERRPRGRFIGRYLKLVLEFQ